MIGFFQNVVWLAILGGCLIVIYDILDILAGILNPTFPIIFSIILASIFKPWYIGIFWASAIWHITGSPWYIGNLLGKSKGDRKYKYEKLDVNKNNQEELERLREVKERNS